MILDPQHPDYDRTVVFDQAEETFSLPTNTTESMQLLANLKSSLALVRGIAATMILAKCPEARYVDPEEIKLGEVNHYGVDFLWSDYNGYDGYSMEGQVPSEYLTADGNTILRKEREAAKARHEAEEARKKREAEAARVRAEKAKEDRDRAEWIRLNAKYGGTK